MGAKYYGIEIGDYVWIETNLLVLPSCTKIGYGAVCGGGSIIVKNVDSMNVVAGIPAVIISKRKIVHDDLLVNHYWEVI